MISGISSFSIVNLNVLRADAVGYADAQRVRIRIMVQFRSIHNRQALII